MNSRNSNRNWKSALKTKVPEAVYRPLLSVWRRACKTPATAQSLTRVTPLSHISGQDRGTPIDRYYLDAFLSRHRNDVRGCVLELADARYTKAFGGERVTCSDVLHLVAGNPVATVIGDLSSGQGIPQNAFDCFLVINTLPLIFDVRAALGHCYAALRPGGVLLANFPGLCPRVPEDDGWVGDYWRFTSMSARALCEEWFPSAQISVEVFGNVRSASASLYGLAAEELSAEELDFRDAVYEVTIGVRAVKPDAP